MSELLLQRDVDYFADTEHLSQSQLKVLQESPQAFYERFIARTLEPEQTEAMRFGSLFHAALLEPEKFLASHAVPPKLDRRTTDGKKRYAEWCDENRGKVPVSPDDYGTLITMQAAVLRHADARAILYADGPIEQPIFWEDRCLRKAKPDKYVPSMGVIADVKTIADPSPRGFAGAAARFGWWLQAAWYRDGLWFERQDDCRFIFICVGKERPHEVGLYELTPDDMEWAEGRAEELVTEYLARRETRNWLAEWQSGDPTRVPLPAWLRSDFYLVQE